jgi:DNA-binding MarR family transcriptional regulator
MLNTSRYDRAMGEPVDPAQLDIGLLALFTGLAANERATAALNAAGFESLRFSHGFLFQHLIDGPRTISELAKLQEISVQAVSKTVNELVADGYLVATTDTADRRSRLISLSDRGWAAVKRARTARARQDKLLERALGADRIDTLRQDLADVLAALGGIDAVQVRNVRLPS